jgi:hypothetical protein
MLVSNKIPPYGRNDSTLVEMTKLPFIPILRTCHLDDSRDLKCL